MISIHDPSIHRKEKMIFLKRFGGVMSIERTFKDVTLMDVLTENHLVVRMGRVDCSPATFSIRLAVTTTVDTGNTVQLFIFYRVSHDLEFADEL
jgi:hypothetical protein